MPSQYRPVAWGKPIHEELTVPSGGLCLVRRIEPLDLLSDEFLGSIDMLGGAVLEQIKRVQSPLGPVQPGVEAAAEQERINKIFAAMSNPDNLPAMIDRVVMRVVVEPRLQPIPSEGNGRSEGDIYIDQVPFEDKMFIFNHAMGAMSALNSFRPQADATVGNVEPLAGISHPTERPAGSG